MNENDYTLHRVHCPLFWFFHLYLLFFNKKMSLFIDITDILNPMDRSNDVLKLSWFAILASRSRFIQDGIDGAPSLSVEQVKEISVGKSFFTIFFALPVIR